MPSIDVLANTREAQRNVRSLSDEFDRVADSLDDVARDAERGGDRVERSFRDMVSGANKAEKAVSDVGEKGMSRAGDSVAEFKSEAIQNLSEVTSSFNGDMTAVGDLVQGTFGGLASSLPGMLGIAGAGAAVGVGLITAALGEADEKAQKVQERAADLSQAYIEAGSTVLDALTVADRTAEILTDPAMREEAEALSDVFGGDLSLAVRLLAGDTAALTEAQTRAAAAEQRNIELSTQTLAASSKRKSANEEERIANEALIEAVREQADVQSQAVVTAQIQSRIYLDLINSVKGVTEEVDEFGNSLYTLPDGKQIVINADTGLASTHIDTFKGDLDGIAQPVTTTVRVRTDTSELDRLRRDLLTPLGVKLNVQAPAGIAKSWQGAP